MRISIARDGTSMRLDAAAAMAVAWPLSLPLDSAVLPPSEGRYPVGGMGLLVNNPNDLSDLRAIRRAFQDLPEGAWWYGFVPIKASADASRYDFILHMRDAVPYEDTRGRIPLTW